MVAAIKYREEDELHVITVHESINVCVYSLYHTVQIHNKKYYFEYHNKEIINTRHSHITHRVGWLYVCYRYHTHVPCM